MENVRSSYLSPFDSFTVCAAGSGKSVLWFVKSLLPSSRTGTHDFRSSAVIDRVISLRDVGLASLAYFYFDSQDIEKKNVRNFLTSLLTQLAAGSENCRKIILRLYAKHGNGTQQPNFGTLTNCLHEML